MKLHAIGLTLLCAFSTLQSNPLKIKTALVVTGAAAAYAYTGYCLHKEIKTEITSNSKKQSYNDDTPEYAINVDLKDNATFTRTNKAIGDILKDSDDTKWF